MATFHHTTALRPALLLATVLMLSALLCAPPARAGTFTVTRTDDPQPNGCTPADCSLREAIIAANTAAGPDRLSLAAGTYTLALAGAGEDAGATGDLDIGGDTTIAGASASATTIDGNRLDRVLDIHSGNVTISGVTIARGSAGSGGQGGAIKNAGALTLASSAVISSTSGVLFSFDGSQGGGIYSTGALQLSGSIVSGNTSDSAGGGIYSTGGLTVTNSTIADNTVGEDSGGAIANLGRAIVRDSSIAGNKTYGAGGGLDNRQNAVLELIDSQVTDNTASEGQAAGGGVLNSGTLTVTGSIISFNTITSTYGGGLYNSGTARLVASTIAANAGFDGPGGIYNDGDLTLIDSAVDANTSQYEPSGVDNHGSFSFVTSTLSRNSVWNSGSLSVNSSTFSAAPVDSSGTLTAINATFTGSDLGIKSSGSALLRSTILAGNTADCEGTIASQGHNLIGNATGCAYDGVASDQVGTSAAPLDPRLGALASNGGPTRTHMPQAGSPAIDRGDPTICPAADQRGVHRPYGAACDIGAVERAWRVLLPLIRRSA